MSTEEIDSQEHALQVPPDEPPEEVSFSGFHVISRVMSGHELYSWVPPISAMQPLITIGEPDWEWLARQFSHLEKLRQESGPAIVQFHGYFPGAAAGMLAESDKGQEVEELRVQCEWLKSLVAQERRAAAREAQKHDQLLMEHKALRETMDRLIELLRERSAANDALQGVLIGDREGRLRMFEHHEGVVMHVDDDSVVVTYSIDDEYVDQTYRKEQFVGGRLPKQGDRLAIYVHVAELPKERDREKTAGAAPDEQRRHRKRAIRPPREF